MHLGRVALHLAAKRVQPLLQLRLGQNLAGTLHERLEQRPLTRGQVDGPPRAQDRARRKIYVEVPDMDQRIGVSGIAPRDSVQPRRQFGEVERLDQIVVGPGIEPLYAVGQLIHRRQDDGRRDIPPAAQVAQEADAAAIGQHQVQQQKIIGSTADMVSRRIQPRDPVHRMALGRDMVAHGLAKNRIILDQQNPHGPHPVSC